MVYHPLLRVVMALWGTLISTGKGLGSVLSSSSWATKSYLFIEAGGDGSGSRGSLSSSSSSSSSSSRLSLRRTFSDGGRAEPMQTSMLFHFCVCNIFNMQYMVEHHSCTRYPHNLVLPKASAAFAMARASMRLNAVVAEQAEPAGRDHPRRQLRV